VLCTATGNTKKLRSGGSYECTIYNFPRPFGDFMLYGHSRYDNGVVFCCKEFGGKIFDPTIKQNCFKGHTLRYKQRFMLRLEFSSMNRKKTSKPSKKKFWELQIEMWMGGFTVCF
jgi:hypothetical protein